MKRYTQKQNTDTTSKQRNEREREIEQKKVNIWAHQITL